MQHVKHGMRFSALLKVEENAGLLNSENCLTKHIQSSQGRRDNNRECAQVFKNTDVDRHLNFGKPSVATY